MGDANSMGDGIANNDYVTTANISGVTSLNVNNQNIADLTGIEDFSSLSKFLCYSNTLIHDTIRFSSLNLDTLELELTGVNNFDFSGMTNLTLLGFSTNNVKYCNLSGCTKLERIYISGASSHPLPQDLNYFNINGCDSLKKLTLNVTSSTLSTLNLSSYIKLEEIDIIGFNQLSSLDVRNGNNINFISFDATGNSNLNCISVDDATWATANWTNIDSHTIFLDDCALYVAFVGS